MVKKRKTTQVIIRAETETDLAKILANLRRQGEFAAGSVLSLSMM